MFPDLLVSDVISAHLVAGREHHFCLTDQTPVQLIPLIPLTQAAISQVIGSWDGSWCHPWIAHWWVVCTLWAPGSRSCGRKLVCWCHGLLAYNGLGIICLWIVIVSPVLGSRTRGHLWDRGEDGCWAHVALDMPDKL